MNNVLKIILKIEIFTEISRKGAKGAKNAKNFGSKRILRGKERE